MKSTLLIVFTLLASTQVQAITRDDIFHGTAHFGGVYALTHATAVICSKVIGKENVKTCTITGVVVGNAINVAYKAAEGMPNDTARSLTYGAAGSAAAALIINLDF